MTLRQMLELDMSVGTDTASKSTYSSPRKGRRKRLIAHSARVLGVRFACLHMVFIYSRAGEDLSRTEFADNHGAGGKRWDEWHGRTAFLNRIHV